MITNVLCITENLGSGGAERQLSGLAVMLKERGFHVKLVTYIDNQFYLDYLLSNEVDYQRIEGANSKWKRLFKLRRAIKDYRPDVVISFLPAPSQWIIMTKLTGLRFKLIVSERSATQKITLAERLKFFLYRFADKVVSNSYSETQFIKHHFKSLEAKCCTITNFTDTDYFSPPYEQNFDDTKLLVVGRLISDKNAITFLNAIHRINKKGYNLRVSWIGSQYDLKYTEQVKSEIKRLDLTNIVTLKDHTNSILDEYKSANLFCLPSLYEGYPNVICEAMSCGLPILCSNVRDNPLIVEDNKNGFLFDPISAEDIANKIIAFLNLEQQQKQQIAIINRETAIEKFRQDSFCDNFINLINNL